MEKKKILLADNIHKTFSGSDSGEDLQILRGLSLAVDAGDSIAIVGVSGSGKSTLLSLLAGLDVPDQGRVEIDGADLTQMQEAQRSILRANKMAFVFQDFMLLPHLTALENVMLPLEMKGEKDAKERAAKELAKVGLGERQRHFPSQLSGGEQQRTALARAFAAHPLLLFADEPNGNLDGATGKQIVDLLFGINQQSQTTLVVVTHDMKLAKMCDKVYELKDGQLRLLEKDDGSEQSAAAPAAAASQESAQQPRDEQSSQDTAADAQPPPGNQAAADVQSAPTVAPQTASANSPESVQT